MSEWKSVCFECSDRKREIRDLKVRVADCEGAIERREQFIAKANSERDSALDAEVVARGECESLRKQLADAEARAAKAERYMLSACAEVLEREAAKIGSKRGIGRNMAKIRISVLAHDIRKLAEESEQAGGEK